MKIPKIFKNPRFYDIFGLPIFSFISLLSIWMLYSSKLPPKWVIWLLLFIGIAGIIVDGTMVSKFLSILKLKKRKNKY